MLISIKANCIDSTAPPEQVFAAEVEKLRAEKFFPKEQLTLEPYERDHAVRGLIPRFCPWNFTDNDIDGVRRLQAEGVCRVISWMAQQIRIVLFQLHDSRCSSVWMAFPSSIRQRRTTALKGHHQSGISLQRVNATRV